MLAMNDRVCPFNQRTCNCDPNAADEKFRPCARSKRAAKFIRMLGSSFPHERESAMQRLQEFMQKEGVTFNDLAASVEEKQFTIDEARHIFQQGKEKGIAEQQQAHSQDSQRILSADYFDDDGCPRWSELVAFCQQNQTRLNPKEQKFIDDMPSQLQWRKPSPPTGGYLLSIFWKLRGSLR
jgi:hypothetical protein